MGARLNLACGQDVREGWLNVDAYTVGQGVVEMDFTKVPWVFADASFDYVLASHAFEHIPPVFVGGRDVLWLVLEECWRVLRSGGVLEIVVPPAGTIMADTHPQHFRRFLPDTFKYFTSDLKGEGPYHGADFELVSCERQYSGVGWKNPVFWPEWRVRGVSVLEHVRTSVPFMRGLVSRRGEIRAVLRKRA